MIDQVETLDRDRRTCHPDPQRNVLDDQIEVGDYSIPHFVSI
jgi:hypothetical protein